MAQYQVNLSFSADTSKAKAQLKDLQNQLTNLINTPQSKLGIEGEINDAIKAAAELKAHLQAATNVKTGNLDFSKLSQSLKQSNTSLTQYATKLQQLGPAGQQAFMTLAQSVAQAEIPIRRSSAALDKMWETLKNTARWQVSSTVLHGFMGAVQSAYGYAQDLNKSLNDIRIVTGQNTDQMAQFAKEANKAAKALSTSTTNYTKASLIYYQQGLSDQQVKDRTDITVKMANVARSSAEDVSDQLTAVWNNFYDGSKSLEHYADVMTALGAATASSTDEISEGLNKFAAIAETVGLSYEYAASALATVTATTRESADVVGNAFKTLFARIQGLKLGETLEDGTDLNKYSQALNAVGIEIKTVNGDIKDMDSILNELGAKWKTLGKDQQIALAQTVAGVRQYAQLIALMDNWDYFQENLGVANNSTGALQKQADIYAESWEAASKRVEAAAQGIYEKLMNDEFFIDLLNSFEKILTFVDNLIDSMGGLKGVLTTLGTLATKVFADKMSQSLSNMAYNVKMMTKTGRQQVQDERKSFIENAVESIPQDTNYTTEIEKAQMRNMRDQLELQALLTDNAEKMSSIELLTNQTLMDRTKILQQQYEKAATAREAADAAVSDATSALRENFVQSAYGDEDAYKQLTGEASSRIKSLQTTANVRYDINQYGAEALEKISTAGVGASQVVAELKKQLEQVGIESQDGDIQDCIQDFITMANAGSDVEFALEELKRRLDELRNVDISELKSIVTDNPEQIDELSRRIDAQTAARKRQLEAEKEAAAQRQETEISIKKSTGVQKSWSDTLVASANAVIGFSSALSMLNGIWDTLQNPDINGWEKFTTIMTTLGMLIPTLVTAWKSLKTVISSETLVKIANTLATWGQVAAEKALNREKGIQPQKIKKNITNIVQNTKEKVRNTADEFKGNFGNIKDSWNSSAWDKASPQLKGKYRTQAVQQSGFKAVGKNQYNFNGQTVDLKTANQGLGEMSKSVAGKQALGGLVKSLGLIAAGIVVIVASVKLLDAWWNKDANAAKKAQEEANTLSQIYDSIKGQYDELKSSISNYQSVVNGLSEMQKGTIEWYEAISQANDEATKLIDTYDNLKYHIEDGLIVIDNLEDIQGQELAKTIVNQRASIFTNQKAKEAQEKADLTAFNRKYAKASGWSGEDTAITLSSTGVGAGAGLAVAGISGLIASSAAAGAAAGSIAPGIGTAIGAAAGALVGVTAAIVSQQDAQKEEEEAMQALVAAYTQDETALVDIESTLRDAGVTDEKLIASLVENADETRALAKNIAANNAALEAAQAQQMQSFLNSNLTGDLAALWSSTEDKDMIAAQMAKSDIYDKTKEAALINELNKGVFGWSWLGGGISDKDLHAQYAKAMGWDLDSQDIKDKTGKGVFTVGDEEITISDETMREFLAEETARTAMALQLQNYVNAFNDIRNEAFNAGIANNLDLNLQDEMGAMVAQFFGGNKDAFVAATQEQIDALSASLTSGMFNITDEQAKLAGYNDAKEYVAAMEEALATYDPTIAATKRAAEEQAEYLNILAQGAEETDISEQALRNYAESLMVTNAELANNKQAAAQAAVENAKFSKGVDTLRETLEKHLDILKEWDEGSLETWESVAEVQGAIEDMFGVTVSTNYVKENLEELQALAEGDTSALEELREEASKDYIVGLGLDETATNTITSFLDEVINQDHNLSIGASVDLGDSVDEINKLLEAGIVTADQVNAAFGAIGYKPNIQFRTVTSDPQRTTSTNTVYLGNQTDRPLFTATTVSDTTTDVSVPYITSSTTGDDISSSGTAFSGSGVGSSMTKTTSVGSLGKSISSKTDEPINENKELDRYHYISRTLEEVEREYDAIANARERAFGVDKLALYDREIAKIEEVQDVLQKYADEAKAYYNQDRIALLSAGYGVQLDDEGNIINYDEVFAAHGQDEKFEELVSNYEDSLDTWKEKLQEVIDKQNELLDLSLEKIQYKIDLAIKIDDQTQEYLDFLIEMADDPLTDAAEKLGYLTQKINSSKQAADKLGDSLHEALKETGWDDSEIDSILAGKNIEELLASNKLTETQIEILEQYRDQLYTTTQMMITFADDIKDTVIEAFDEMGKTYDESAEKLEHYNKILTTYENIIDLVGRDTLGISDNIFGQLTQAQVDNAVSLLTVHKEAYETDRAALQQLRDSYNENWSDDAKEAWNEAIEHAEEKVRESEVTMFDSWESALQAAADAFEKAVETAVKTYEKAMSGIYGSFDTMQTAYERQTTLNERYLEDYEKIYELSKLNRQVTNSIDDTDNIKSKKILKELQDEILGLSESEAEISEYQIGHLQKEYELKMALIALEEAQNAKSQVRMQRDSEGNWSYVYTADEAKVDDAQQNYEDKLFALQEYTQEYIQTNSDALMQLQQEYADAMSNIKRENYATQEEYEAALAETTAFYEQMMNYHLGEIGLATTNAQELYEQDWAKYSEMTDYKLSKDKDWIDSWDETQIALTTGLKTVEDYQTNFQIASTDMINALSEAYGTWKDNVNIAMDAASTATDKFADTVEADIKEVQGYSETLASYLDDIGDAAQKAFKEVVDAAAENSEYYSDEVAGYIKQNQKLIDSLNEIIRKKAEVEGALNQDAVNMTDENIDGQTGDLSGNAGELKYTFNKSQYYDTIDSELYDEGPLTLSYDQLKDLKRSGIWGNSYTFTDDSKVEHIFDDDEVRAALKAVGLEDLYEERPTPIQTSSTPQSSYKDDIEEDADQLFEKGDQVKVKNSDWKTTKSNPYQPGQSEYSGSNRDPFVVQDVVSNSHGQNWYQLPPSYDMGGKHMWMLERDLLPFDTGGYTGAWEGTNGRLAMLHKKELVLNADDTRNMLQAVEIVRKIVRVIDLNAANAANAFGVLTATTAATNDQIIEQEVTIHAEFPNATNHSEIEEAFNSLINQASQFANRKK